MGPARLAGRGRARVAHQRVAPRARDELVAGAHLAVDGVQDAQQREHVRITIGACGYTGAMSKGTPLRRFRCGELWGQAMAVAEHRGDTVTSVLVRALRAYVRRHAAEVGIDPTDVA